MRNGCAMLFLVTTARPVDIARWAQGQRLAQRRIASEARRRNMGLDEALERVDELRRFAGRLGAGVSRERAERENLAFHLTWQRVRRAYGLG